MEPWAPDLRGASDRLASAVGQAVGSASMCWENPAGAGIFDSDAASRVVTGLVQWIRTELFDLSCAEAK